MTRMVEEHRVEIGSLKALGYGPAAISMKYIGYGLLPSLIGGVLGLAIGYTLFPGMIFTAYQLLYEVPSIQLHAYFDITVISMLAAVACTTVSTLGALWQLSACSAAPSAVLPSESCGRERSAFLPASVPEAVQQCLPFWH